MAYLGGQCQGAGWGASAQDCPPPSPLLPHQGAASSWDSSRCRCPSWGAGEGAPNLARGDNHPPPRLPDKAGPDGPGVGTRYQPEELASRGGRGATLTQSHFQNSGAPEHTCSGGPEHTGTEWAVTPDAEDASPGGEAKRGQPGFPRREERCGVAGGPLFM